MIQSSRGTTIPPLIMRKKRAIVIGGGIGGLASAIRLQASGLDVTLIEARERLGGRAYQLQSEGFTFDMGPSLITAPHLLRELWSLAGRDLQEDLTLVPLSPYYRISFRDGRYFDYWGTEAEDEAEIARFEPHDVAGYRRFLATTKCIYQRAFVDLADQPFLTMGSFLRVLPELISVRAQQSVYTFASRYFRSPHLRTVFSFHPLFIGGMYSLVSAMEKLFYSLGGTVRCGIPVAHILLTERRATGVRLEDGHELQAEAVIANSDVASTYLTLLPVEYRSQHIANKMKRYRYSMSCFLLYLGLNKQYPQLRHHTILMPTRYRELIHQIFDGRGLPDDIALYIHTPTRTDPSMAPPGGESLYALAPVPNLAHGIDWTQDATMFRNRVINFLEQEAGLEGLSNAIMTEHVFSPLDFANTLRSYQGAAFSIEPTLFQSAYFRPHNQASDISNLYFVGAGTHPGAGIPGVLLSAAISSRLVLADLDVGSAKGV